MSLQPKSRAKRNPRLERAIGRTVAEQKKEDERKGEHSEEDRLCCDLQEAR